MNEKIAELVKTGNSLARRAKGTKDWTLRGHRQGCLCCNCKGDVVRVKRWRAAVRAAKENRDAATR